MADDIRARVVEVLCQELGVEEDETVDTATLNTDLGMDSLDTVEIVMAVEEEFGLEVPDADAERWVTVGDIVAYVERRQAAQA